MKRERFHHISTHFFFSKERIRSHTSIATKPYVLFLGTDDTYREYLSYEATARNNNALSVMMKEKKKKKKISN